MIKGTSTTTMPELAFVLAPRQNLFFNELVEALRNEITRLGGRSSLHVGGFPSPREDLVYVVVPPHEYFTLMHGRIGPPPEALQRSIFICAEQPDTPFFEENVALAPLAGAVFDISRDAVRAFALADVDAEHLQLGWTQEWDRLPEARDSHHERDIDVLFMGCMSEHREEALATYARSLWRRNTRLVLSDNSRPNWVPSGSFSHGDPKFDLLGRSKVIINLHQGDSPYFEWLRMVQAMSNGAVVVTENSRDYEPLLPGEHFLSGRSESLHLLAELLLDEGDLRWKYQTEAYDFLRRHVRLRDGVAKLIAAAQRIAEGAPVPQGEHAFFMQPPPDPERLPLFAQPTSIAASARGNNDEHAVRRALKDIKLDLRMLRNQQHRLELAVDAGKMPPKIELVEQSSAYSAINPAISVLMALYNYEDHVETALDSLIPSQERSWEVIIVDDGSSDKSRQVVSDWIANHGNVAAVLLAHPVNRGLAHSRNAALGWARGEFSFVLDADNEILPTCLGRLSNALYHQPNAAFAYGILERFGAGKSIGLMGVLPWDPQRLRTGNYIDAMALMRTSIVRDRLGGYIIDPRFHGWEDYELWCRIANLGYSVAHVPEIVARYRSTQHSMLSLTNLSITDAFSLMIERYPRLMSGMSVAG
jgi:hypothetical protein